MSDDAERRQRRRFEPPPWEQEGFEALAGQRAAAEAAEAGRAAEAARTAQQPPAEPPREAEPAAAPVALTGEEPKSAPAIDDREVAAMLIELSGEEGSAKRPVVQAGKVTAIVLVTIGVAMMLVAAVLALRAMSPTDQSGPGAGTSAPGVSRPATETAEAAAMEGGVGAAVIAVLGGFVAGFAGWMWVRANREQGS